MIFLNPFSLRVKELESCYFLSACFELYDTEIYGQNYHNLLHIPLKRVVALALHEELNHVVLC